MARARLLGPLGFELDGRVVEPSQSLVPAVAAYLVRSCEWVDRGALAYLFWPDVETPRAQVNLRQVIATLRRADYAAGIEIERTRIRLLLPSDAADFELAVRRGDYEAAIGLHERGPLEPWRFDAYPEYQAWLGSWRTSSWALWREAVAALAVRARAAGDDASHVRLTAALHAHDPDDEGTLRQSVLALADAGRSEEALVLLQRHVERVRAEYGVEPGPLVPALTAVLAGLPSAAEQVPAANPLPVRPGPPADGAPPQVAAALAAADRFRMAHQHGDRAAALAAMSTVDLAQAWAWAMDEQERGRVADLLAVMRICAREDDSWIALARHAQQALSLARPHETSLLAGAHAALAEATIATGNTGAAREHAARTIESATAAGDHDAVAAATSVLGRAEALTGNLERAKTLHEEALSAYATRGDNWRAANEHLHLGSVANMRGARGEAMRHHVAARTTFSSVGDAFGTGDATLRLGLVALDRGDASEALVLFDQASITLRNVRASRASIAMRRASVRAALQLGRYQRALEEVTAWAELLAAGGLDRPAFDLRYWRGSVLLELGHLERAMVEAAAAAKGWSHPRILRPLASALSLQADLAALTGDIEAARALGRQALALRLEFGDGPGTAVSQARLALVACQAGDLDEAEHHMGALRDRLGTLPDETIRLRCLVSACQVELALANTPVARRHLAAAVDLALGLDLPPLRAAAALAVTRTWSSLGRSEEAAWGVAIIRSDTTADATTQRQAALLDREVLARLGADGWRAAHHRAKGNTVSDLLHHAP